MYPHKPHQHTEPILKARDISLRYDGRAALEQVTFELHTGERVAVVGPNGAGKSTLLKIVAGVLRPTTGEVTIFGSGPRGHVCIGYIPQRSQVDWRFPVNVADVVMMGRIARLGLFGIPSKKDWDFVHSALEQVGMQAFAARQIGELSGGQQQRMFIARALAQQAELMLMDEPMAGLDSPAQESLLSLLEGLRAQHVTMMVATHDLEQARAHFDRILLLNHHLIAFGVPDAVLQAEILLAAYGNKAGGHGQAAGLAVLDDPCCGEEEHEPAD